MDNDQESKIDWPNETAETLAMRIYDMQCKLQQRFIELTQRSQSTLVRLTQEDEFEMIMTRWILISH